MNEPATKLPPLVDVEGVIAEIIPAPAPNRSGRVVLEDGKRLGAFPDKLAKLAEGQAYRFGCTKRVVDGVVYHDVKTWKHLTPNGHQAEPVTRPQAPQQGNGKKMDQYFKPTSPRDSKRMFICSLMNAMIQSRQVVLDTGPLTDAVTMLGDVYDRTVGKEDDLPGS